MGTLFHARKEILPVKIPFFILSKGRHCQAILFLVSAHQIMLLHFGTALTLKSAYGKDTLASKANPVPRLPLEAQIKLILALNLSAMDIQDIAMEDVFLLRLRVAILVSMAAISVLRKTSAKGLTSPASIPKMGFPLALSGGSTAQTP